MASILILDVLWKAITKTQGKILLHNLFKGQVLLEENIEQVTTDAGKNKGVFQSFAGLLDTQVSVCRTQGKPPNAKYAIFS